VLGLVGLLFARRDYSAGADLSSADAGLDQLPAWFGDYNAVAPHSALGYQSPQQYRSTLYVLGANGLAPECLTKRGTEQALTWLGLQRSSYQFWRKSDERSLGLPCS